MSGTGARGILRKRRRDIVDVGAAEFNCRFPRAATLRDLRETGTGLLPQDLPDRVLRITESPRAGQT